MIAQVVTGIGFIGAGVIIKDQTNVVKGITTAATIWFTAMVGLIFGKWIYRFRFSPWWVCHYFYHLA